MSGRRRQVENNMNFVDNFKLWIFICITCLVIMRVQFNINITLPIQIRKQWDSKQQYDSKQMFVIRINVSFQLRRHDGITSKHISCIAILFA